MAGNGFLVFGQNCDKEILGNSPTLEIMFNTILATHDGPVHVSGLQSLHAAEILQGFY